MAKYTTITVRLPVALKDQVNEARKKEDRSMTKYVERALRAAVEQSKRG